MFSSIADPITSTGSLASAGYLGTWLSRFITSMSARSTEMPTSNVNATVPNPCVAVETIFSTPGTPRRTSSCTSMISDSTSSGAAARQLVLMVIRGMTTVGIICTGICVSAMEPNSNTSRTATAAATGFPSASLVSVMSSHCVAECRPRH